MSIEKWATFVAASLMVHTAMAADLPSPATPLPAPILPLFTWTGFHLGVNAGYATRRDRLDGDVPDLDAVLPGAGKLALRQSSDGFTGGGQLGYDYQFESGRGVVVGIEADFDYTDLDRTTAIALPPGVPLRASYTSRLEELGTLRGRAGYAFGRVLVYGTGGFAFGEALRAASLTAGDATIARTAIDDLDMGYAVGGGVEYALPATLLSATLPGSVTLRGEYIHYDLAQRSTPLSLFGQNTVVRMHNEGDLGRFGVNYRF